MARPVKEHHAVIGIEYDGTPYYGWTRQPNNRRTLEGDLLHVFALLGCRDVKLRCAGRTDAGVHAVGQVVDARYTGAIEPAYLHRALSGRLPAELKAHSSEPAITGFDARRDATSRAYEYRVLTSKTSSPLRSRYTHHHPRPLDRAAMHQAAAMVRGQHRFTAFTPTQGKHSFFDRTISESYWFERGDEFIYFVRANAFLRHMVRILVGTMLEVGRGELDLSDLAAALDAAPRSRAGRTAPPNGLCFMDATWEPMPGLPLPPTWRRDRKVCATISRG